MSIPDRGSQSRCVVEKRVHAGMPGESAVRKDGQEEALAPLWVTPGAWLDHMPLAMCAPPHPAQNSPLGRCM